jgi:hypothetical protein
VPMRHGVSQLAHVASLVSGCSRATGEPGDFAKRRERKGADGAGGAGSRVVATDPRIGPQGEPMVRVPRLGREGHVLAPIDLGAKVRLEVETPFQEHSGKRPTLKRRPQALTGPTHSA